MRGAPQSGKNAFPVLRTERARALVGVSLESGLFGRSQLGVRPFWSESAWSQRFSVGGSVESALFRRSGPLRSFHGGASRSGPERTGAGRSGAEWPVERAESRWSGVWGFGYVGPSLQRWYMGLFPPAKGKLVPHNGPTGCAPDAYSTGQYCLLGGGGKDEHHTSITKGITNNNRQSQQATTAAGYSTIIHPFWIRPSHLNWEAQKQSTSTSTISLSFDPHST